MQKQAQANTIDNIAESLTSWAQSQLDFAHKMVKEEGDARNIDGVKKWTIYAVAYAEMLAEIRKTVKSEQVTFSLEEMEELEARGEWDKTRAEYEAKGYFVNII